MVMAAAVIKAVVSRVLKSATKAVLIQMSTQQVEISSLMAGGVVIARFMESM